MSKFTDMVNLPDKFPFQKSPRSTRRPGILSVKLKVARKIEKKSKIKK